MALAASPSVAYEQAATATLSGTVVDETGAVIPDVQITLVSLGTGLQRSAKTGSEGAFVIPLLPPGRYSVIAQRNGFAPAEIKELVLNVGDEVMIRLRLKVAAIGEAVTVLAEPSRINTSPAVGTIVDRQFVESLPLNGRSFQSLIALTPGLVTTKTDFQNQGQFSVNGQRSNANYLTVDGVSANIGVGLSGATNQQTTGSLPGLTAFGGTNNLVSIDAMQEFRIQTSTFAPEFGRTPGAQISIVTRSGGDTFHGSVSEYFRDDAMDANDWFANSRELPKPPMRQHDFGGVVGGPILRKRLFFFFSYEGLRMRLPQVATDAVPNITTRESAVPQIRPFLRAYPLPNGRDLGGGLAEVLASYSDSSTLNATSIRVDHSLGNRVQLFARFSEAPSNIVVRGAGTNTLNSVTHDRIDTRTFTAGSTFTLTPSMTNELRANWSRVQALEFTMMDDFGGALLLPQSTMFPAPNTERQAFSFSIVGATTIREGTNGDNSQEQLNIVDTFTYVKGRHHFKAGIDYRRLTPTTAASTYSLSPVFNTVAQVLAGQASSIPVFQRLGRRRLRMMNVSAFAQDTFRWRPRLTLTYGVRWEYNTPPTERDDNLYTVTGLDDPPSIRLAARGTPLWDATVANFAPRVGLAYELSSAPGAETVIRGGAGVFYDLGTGAAATNAGAPWYPNATSTIYTNEPFPLDALRAAPPPFRAEPSNESIVGFDPNLQLPRTYQFSAALERSLGSGQAVTVTYVGALGRKLIRQDALFNVNAQFGLVRAVRNLADSDYHSLQLQFQRRLSRGFQALASYTLGRSRDTASSDAVTFAPATSVDPEVDRAPSDFDVRHAASAAAVYTLPEWRGGLASAFLSGWSIDAIVRAQSAAPVNVFQSRNIGFGFFSSRPDPVANVSLYIDDPMAPGGRRLNRAAFILPANRQGTLPRNALRGFPAWQIDLAFRRRFQFAGPTSLQFGVEFFNVTNRPNFADPVSNLASPQFGLSTSMLGRGLGGGGLAGGLSPLYQIGGPRSIQLVLKFSF